MGVLNRLYALSLLFKSYDILTTTIAVSINGLHVEANPLIRLSIDHLGLDVAMLLNFIVSYVMISSIHYKKNIAYMALITGLLTVVVVNNILGLLVM